MGGKLKREETHEYLWLTRVDIWQQPTQHCEAISLQLKINKFGGKSSYHKGNVELHVVDVNELGVVITS